ncbi:nucleoside triphosphate pyrophosphohydrolase [Thiococcus pfennigii]|jgi:MazG family protein|uniref:nucleoside triphosphate pyrophosphohydrolase n=1 Tax=Thiococcus pfennigii TaxID=1057 RepID=UPI001908C7C8|nr:nucleoside triphosphate pyrophosphohydrolase [Thiococcus pfennigii]MBK1701812.1 nucleoside triphosphate pyrophosphohydrolase [Thiococcus pfennigii]MBK1730424.1 nucleoside triphosphate pyrophosphohydrolase [Thiococcus pfennigii]
MSRPATVSDLLAIMARLRDPQGGCPWDLAQTFRTILPYTLEEAYEVAEAIEEGDMDALRDELGDLLLQVVFHARMAEEQDRFAFADVVQAICDKMIRRHPHVFADADLRTDAELRANWERTKAAERAAKRPAEAAGALDGVARALPALARAEKLQRRARAVGFDWDDIDGVLDKVREELAECRATLAEEAPAGARQHEIGDLLFACVNLARHMDVEAEQALRAANARFERRFAHIEAGLRATGLAPGPTVREEMERLWAEAKAHEAEGERR